MIDSAFSTQRATPSHSRIRMTANAFLYLLWRDIWVTLRNWGYFLATTLIQPLFFLFVFGRILPMLGQADPQYSTLFLPGIVGLTILVTAMQSVALPLTIEFGYTKEIEDRLLAPIPVWLVGIQKIFFAAIRGLIAGAMIFPIGRIILGNLFSVSTQSIGLLVLTATLGAFSGAAIGLALGTYVQPSQIGLMFSLVLTPLLFTGCVYYPWALLDKIRWFQVVTCFSPLTYTSEGLRASLAPQLYHMPLHFIILGQVAFLLIFGYLGIRGFLRKAVG